MKKNLQETQHEGTDDNSGQLLNERLPQGIRQTTTTETAERTLAERANPQISIIISTWNCRSQIEKCLKSIPSRPDIETIIIDQGSTDGTREFLQNGKGNYWAIFANSRWTWTQANEYGVDVAQADWIALSNPDIVFSPDFFEKLMEGARKYPTFVIGCHCLAPDGRSLHPMAPLTLQSIFHVASHRTLGTIIDRKLLRRFFERHFIMEIPKTDAIVGHLNAHFMLFHRSVLDDTGLWDSRLRWAAADSDILRKAEMKGHLQVWLRDAKLVHEGEFSRKKTTKRLYEYEYAYGYKIYSKIWKLRTLPFLFAVDALIAPVIVSLAKQDSLRNQILCSAARFQGLLA